MALCSQIQLETWIDYKILELDVRDIQAGIYIFGVFDKKKVLWKASNLNLIKPNHAMEYSGP